MKSFTVFALEHFPLIDSGDDIAKIIVETAMSNRFEFEDGDLIVVAQKIFSKAEKRVISLNDVFPSEKAKELGTKTADSKKKETK